MVDLIKSLGDWGVPTVIISSLVIIFILLQLIGEIISLCGKSVPEIMKVRKYFARKRKEKLQREELFNKVVEQSQVLAEVKATITDFNSHYSVDNIAKRNAWINKVNESLEKIHKQNEHYDAAIDKFTEAMKGALDNIASNTSLTEDMFVQSYRDRIIDFASRAVDHELPISREEFNRIFKVYQRYEDFLSSRRRENGEVSTNYELIKEGYEYRVRHHSFTEDLRNKK